MDDETAKLQLLTEIGFVAAGYGMLPRALIIFDGLRAARPEGEFPVIGMAMSLINVGKYAEAANLLYKQLKKNRDSDHMKALLGMSLNLAGRPQDAHKLFEEVIAADREPTAVKIARNFIAPDGSAIQNPNSTPAPPSAIL